MTPPFLNIYAVRRLNLARLINERFEGRQIDFAKAMQFDPSMVSRLLSENPQHKQPIGAKLARSIEIACALPENSLDYLIVGDGKSDDHSYNAIDYDVRLTLVPIIGTTSTARFPGDKASLQGDDKLECVRASAKVSPQAFALRVVGDSMLNPSGSPSFADGMLLIVDPVRRPESDQFVIARLASQTELTFKQYVRDGGRAYLKPLNPRYPVIELTVGAQILGVVVEAILKLT